MALLGLDLAMRGTFFILLGIFTIYTLFLGYHWFTYGANARTATIALSSYLLGSAILFLLMSMVLFT